MASFAAKLISKKLLGETLENNFGKDDPYFERVPATRLDGTPSKTKMKKRPKALPAGLSRHDEQVLTKVKRRAYRLDMSLFNCCGIRFGWSSVIGIIPAIGDVVDAFMAMMVLRTCQQVEGGLPSSIKTKMMTNILLDFVVGLVPFIGDVADALFRANTRNAVVLEKYLREKGAKKLRDQGHSPPALDPTDPDEFDRHEREDLGPPSKNVSTTPSRHGTQTSASRPGQSQQQPLSEERSGRGGGWFSKKRQPDVEHGDTRRREEDPLPQLPKDDRLPSNEPQRNTLQKSRH